MAAPTLVGRTLKPDSNEPNLPYVFSVGFYNSVQITSVFKWTNHPTRTNEWYLELAAGGDPTSTITANTIQAVRAMWFAGNSGRWTQLTRGDTSVGLNELEYDYSDPNSLGYSTLSVYVTGGGTPLTDAVMFNWDEAISGDGGEGHTVDVRWWIDRTASATAFAAWPDRYRYATDPRRADTTIDMAGTEPTTGHLSGVVGPSAAFVLTAGDWTIKARATNKSGEYTDQTFTVTVAADATTTYVIDSGGGGDYTTTAAAIADLSPADDITLFYASGHTETVTTELAPTGSNWNFVWDGVGTQPVLTVNNTNVFRLTTGQYGIRVDGLKITPSGTTCQARSVIRPRRNRCAVMVGVNIGGSGVGNCFQTVASFQSKPASGERVDSVLLFNVVAENGFMTYSTGGEAASAAEINPPEQFLYRYGGRLGPSDNESSFRQTHPAMHDVSLYVDYREDDTGSSGTAKDSMRFAWGEGGVAHGCRLTSALRLGQTSAEHHCARLFRITANLTEHESSGGVLSSIAIQPGVRDGFIANNVVISNHGGSAGGIVGFQSAPADEDNPEEGYYRNENILIAHNTMVMESGTGDALVGSIATAKTAVTDMVFENNAVVTPSGSTWTGDAETANDATITGTDTGITAIDAETFVPTGASTVTRTAGVFDDMWGNVRTTSTYATAAVAAPLETSVTTYKLPTLGVDGNPTYTGSGASQTPVYGSGADLPTVTTTANYYGNADVARFILAQQGVRMAVFGDSLWSGFKQRLGNGVYRTWPVLWSAVTHQPHTLGSQFAYNFFSPTASPSTYNSDSGWCQNTALLRTSGSYANVNDIYSVEGIVATEMPQRFLWWLVAASGGISQAFYQAANQGGAVPDATIKDATGVQDYRVVQDGTRIRGTVVVLGGATTSPSVVRVRIRYRNSVGTQTSSFIDYTLASVTGDDRIDLSGGTFLAVLRTPVVQSYASNSNFYPSIDVLEPSAGAWTGKSLLMFAPLVERIESDGSTPESGIGLHYASDASGRNPEVFLGGAEPPNASWNNHGATRAIRNFRNTAYGSPNTFIYCFGLNSSTRYNSTFQQDLFDLLYQDAEDYYDANGEYPNQVIVAEHYASNMDATRHAEMCGVVAAARATFNDKVLLVSPFNILGGENYVSGSVVGDYTTTNVYATDGDGVHMNAEEDAEAMAYMIWRGLEAASREGGSSLIRKFHLLLNSKSRRPF